ncbi:MAG: hypothetical protein ABI460_19130 [Caldimonas sp.]
MRTAARAAAPQASGRDAFLARAFATDAADLDVSIDPARPVASTDALLTACLRDGSGHRPEVDTVRRWTVASRLDALAEIREASGASTEWVAFHCEAPGCAERFEAELNLGACRVKGMVATIEFAVAGDTMRARLPTGADQARWQQERMPLHLVAASLLDSGESADAAVIAALDAALAEADPARELQLDLVCPACAAPQRRVVNLEAQLLGTFAREQQTLLRQIVRLARAFHWAEAEIVRMPVWRRDFYLGRLDAEGLDEGAQ